MKLSILITNYNKSDLIDRAIRSAENQLLVNHSIEIIVVDDASTDSPRLWLDKYRESKRLTVVYLEHNIGVAGASNKAFETSDGSCVMRLDADDYLNPTYCELACELLTFNPEYGYVYSDIMSVDKYGNKKTVIKRHRRDSLLEYGAGAAIRRDCIVAVGFFDPGLRNCEDRDFFLRLEKANIKGFHIPIPYYRYYSVPNSLTKNGNREEFQRQVDKQWNSESAK